MLNFTVINPSNAAKRAILTLVCAIERVSAFLLFIRLMATNQYSVRLLCWKQPVPAKRSKTEQSIETIGERHKQHHLWKRQTFYDFWKTNCTFTGVSYTKYKHSRRSKLLDDRFVFRQSVWVYLRLMYLRKNTPPPNPIWNMKIKSFNQIAFEMDGWTKEMPRGVSFPVLVCALVVFVCIVAIIAVFYLQTANISYLFNSHAADTMSMF